MYLIMIIQFIVCVLSPIQNYKQIYNDIYPPNEQNQKKLELFAYHLI